MDTEKQREALGKSLSDTLSRTIDFLKFAETKNAALLAFVSAWLLALANLLTSDHPLPDTIRLSGIASLFLFVSAALIALFSFLPRLSLRDLHRDPDRAKSLLYFGDIAEYEASAYVKRFHQRYSVDPQVTISDEYLHDLAIQISANSKIAFRKFTLFNWAAGMIMLALVQMAATGSILAYLHLWPQQNSHAAQRSPQ
ncbi:Pycsar system effector family protein [Bradyrhizobium sp. SZCCHNS2096]|uniref:Pycsar system effector family protein n=1 Tax=Bradyrhizobium sp. SZCCHNS2096 TaxID=3057309 RepID=UPI0029170AB6|nr:Pycsar system effector family protein [Bradyrhizobium sp. SZCCHNS2096]